MLTVESIPSDEAVLALGRKLVKELELEPSVDTLGRWMAHYLAELIVKAEDAIGNEKREAQARCYETILALWEHRSLLPDGSRPFEEIEPVMRAVASLSPENSTPRYYTSARPPADEVDESSESEKWLEIANELDRTARILVGYCLSCAADGALDKAKEWVELAQEAGLAGDVEHIVLRFIKTADDLEEEQDPNKEERDRLEKRLEQLEFVTELTEMFSQSLREKIKALSTDDDSVDKG